MYWLTVIFLFLLPLQCFGDVLIVAHRGASQDYPENTVVAIESAIEAQSNLIEFDVRAVKDGQLYLFHDRDLKRFGLGKKLVAELSTDEL